MWNILFLDIFNNKKDDSNNINLVYTKKANSSKVVNNNFK